MREKVVPRRGKGQASEADTMPRAKLIAEVRQAAGDKPGTGFDANAMTHRWATLRRALVAARQSDYDAALEAARASWTKNADLLPRAALAFAFPDEADWATTTTQALLDQIKKQKGKIAPYEAGLGLLAAVASADLQTALAKAAAAKRVALYRSRRPFCRRSQREARRPRRSRRSCSRKMVELTARVARTVAGVGILGLGERPPRSPFHGAVRSVLVIYFRHIARVRHLS